MAVRVSKGDVIAFRLHVQHLTERGDERYLLDAAGAPFYFPTADASVFTAGVLPPTEEGMRQFILGVGPAVDQLGLSLTETVALTGAEIRHVLSGRRLAVDELGKELAQRIAGKLSAIQRDIWEREGPHVAGQPLGEAVAHFCLRILTLQGVVCFAPRDKNRAPFVLVDEWLGHPIQGADPKVDRAELLRDHRDHDVRRAEGPGQESVAGRGRADCDVTGRVVRRCQGRCLAGQSKASPRHRESLSR